MNTHLARNVLPWWSVPFTSVRKLLGVTFREVFRVSGFVSIVEMNRKAIGAPPAVFPESDLAPFCSSGLYIGGSIAVH